MKKSLLPMSLAAILSSISGSTIASSVIIPNVFTADSAAVAADVNANFNALATGVNDNDSRTTTNAAGVASNTGNITSNDSDIATNAGNVSTNQGNIGTNVSNIATNNAAIVSNATNIATNTAAIASGAACPSDMVAAGPICVDLYEASIWDAATGGTQLPPTAAINGNDASSFYRCVTNASDCGSSVSTPNTLTAIFARSEVGVLPALNITWYQANQACANVGKRLPTVVEWQLAASGTPDGGATATDCNSNTGNVLLNTGSIATCVSTAGAFDMVGNLMEWSGDIDIDPAIVSGGGGATGMDVSIATALGNSFPDNVGGLSPNTKAIFALTNGPDATNPQVGFRCVK